MDLKNEVIEAQRNVKVIILAGKYLTHVIFVRVCLKVLKIFK